MGGGASTDKSAYEVARKFKRSDIDIVKLMMPVYFVEDPVQATDIELAKGAWNLIVEEKNPNFDKFKASQSTSDSESESSTSCMMWFYDTFYTRLFDVHPTCRPLFKGGLRQQGKFLVKMLSLSLSLLNNAEKFNSTLIDLAEKHCERGIKAIEYGVVGEVLFFTLKHVLSEGIYTPNVHFSWVKVFSRILKVMVPVAVAYEMKVGYELEHGITKTEVDG